MFDELQAFEFQDEIYAQILRLLCEFKPEDRKDAENKITELLGKEILDTLWSVNFVTVAPCIKQPNNIDMTCITVEGELRKLANTRGLQAELDEVSQASDEELNDTNIWRITRAVEAKQKALLPDLEDKQIYDTATNGVRINRTEKDGFKKVLSEITFSRKKK